MRERSEDSDKKIIIFYPKVLKPFIKISRVSCYINAHLGKMRIVCDNRCLNRQS